MSPLRLPTDTLNKISQVTDILDELKDVHRKIECLEKIYAKLAILESVNAKLDSLHAAVGLDMQAMDIDDTPAVDAIGHVKVLEDMVGLHEVRDRQTLEELFQNHTIPFDPNAWCGATVRYAICEAGFPDPGERYHKASAWASYGRATDTPEAPGTIVVYYSHVSVKDSKGGEIGGNVTDSIKVMPKGQNWFGNPIAHRQIDIENV